MWSIGSWGQRWSQRDQGAVGPTILMQDGDRWNHGRDSSGSEEEAVPEDTVRRLSGVLSFSSFTVFRHRKIVLEKFKGQSF